VELLATKESVPDAGTRENHLVLSLDCRGDDQIVPNQMSQDLALRRQCVGGYCHEASQHPD
jgi:hypothetical protein